MQIAGLDWFSKACLVLAIAALGMKTCFMPLTRAGWQPIALIVFETAWLAALVLAPIARRH